MKTRSERRKGFTLVEMMIVIAIIGLLAAIAIPSFRNYQFSTKRAEAYGNLAALVKTEKSYFAEHGAFVGVPIAEPGNTQGTLPIAEKRSNVELEAAFASVGWAPDGDVFYDYDAAAFLTANGQDHPDCACSTCLTATAYGDVDGDGSRALITYIQPTEDYGSYCTTGFFGHGPPIDANGNPRFSEIVRLPVGPQSDDY